MVNIPTRVPLWMRTMVYIHPPGCLSGCENSVYIPTRVPLWVY